MKKYLSILPLNILESWWVVSLQYLIFFFSPVVWLIIGVGIMVAFDWITGMARARKQGEKIISGGFYRTFVKYLMYAIGILSTRMMEVILKDKIDVPFASLLAGFIIVIEYKSIMENISAVVGVNLWELVKDKIIKIKK